MEFKNDQTEAMRRRLEMLKERQRVEREAAIPASLSQSVTRIDREVLEKFRDACRLRRLNPVQQLSFLAEKWADKELEKSEK